MTRARKWLAAAAVPAAALVALAALTLRQDGLATQARASVPTDPPTFSTPTDFSNAYFPFQPGTFRIDSGHDHGDKALTLDSFLKDTRDFDWDGGTVTCRILQETNFEDGALVEDTRNYFAEADDGSVYYFGETVDEYEDGVIVGHGGSWLVGGGGQGDPPGTLSVTDPALFMPANPEVGDEFMPENVPGGPQEVDTILRTGLKVRTPAGMFEDCIEVLETNPVEGDTEHKWYAPGVGVLKGRAKGESFILIATTISTGSGD